MLQAQLSVMAESLAVAKDFYLHYYIQTQCEAHPAFHSTDTWVSFQGGKVTRM